MPRKTGLALVRKRPYDKKKKTERKIYTYGNDELLKAIQVYYR